VINLMKCIDNLFTKHYTVSLRYSKKVLVAKQVLGIAGTNVMQAKYTPNHDKKCPSCGKEDKTCGHVLLFKPRDSNE
jgi:hypothetical protein